MRTWAMIVSVLIGLASGASVTSAASSDEDARRCEAWSLQQPPSFVSYAVWAEGSERLLVIDNASRSLHVLTKHGETELRLELSPSSNAIFPVTNPRSQNQEYVELHRRKDDGTQLLLWRDDSLRPKQTFDLRDDASRSGYQLGSVYTMTIAGDHLVGYGSVRRPGAPRGDFVGLGVFARRILPLESRGDVRLLIKASSEETQTFYQYEHPLFAATLDNTVYFLFFDPEVDPQPLLYAYGPSGLARPQMLAGYRGTGGGISLSVGLRDAYQALEHYEGPIGLYSQDSFVYVLERKPEDAGRTRWTLKQLERLPGRVEVIGEILLPTDAKHLTVVPTPDEWIVFEKGSVDDEGQQAVSTLLTIPRSWIRDMFTSPLSGPASANVRCRDASSNR